MGEIPALIDLLLERSGKPIAEPEAIFYFLSQAFNCRDCAKNTARAAKVFLVRDPLI